MRISSWFLRILTAALQFSPRTKRAHIDGRHGGLDLLKAFRTPGEPAGALGENVFARLAFEHGEKADADAKLIFRRRFFFGET